MARRHVIALVVGLPLAAQLAAGAAAVTGAAVAAALLLQQPPGLQGRVIALDPGHGGFDGGFSTADLVEKDVNLDLARRLEREIARRGGRAILTRAADVAYAENNRADFDRRLERVAPHRPEALLSIHCNSFPDPSQFGAQAFYPPGRPEAQRLALLIQEELVRLHPENYREALEGEFYITDRFPGPAVLVEVGFLTNAGDRQRLRDPAWRDRLAAALADALARFFAGERPRA